jgi:myo-inositol-1(or 4)-monophosphatase
VTDLGAELRRLAETIAVEAGALVRAGRGEGLPMSGSKSTATDVVTVFDTASERLIVERLAAARPGDAIIGEEGADHPGTSGIRWLVDPIDGTTNFLYGLPGYAVSIAALDHGGAIAGAVHLPVTDELFSAARHAGATLNGRPIRCSGLDDVSLALVATGFSYGAQQRGRQGRRAAVLLPHIRDLRRLGAAAADLCHVACGRLDAYYEQYLNPWDSAAGGLIAAEAGAIVGSFAGAPGEPDGLLVAAPDLFEPLRELLHAAAPEADEPPN